MDRTAVVAIAFAVALGCCAGAMIFWYSASGGEYEVSYETDGGILAPNTPKTYTHGVYLDVPNPSKEGAVFGGWYLDADLSNPFTGDTRHLSGNIVLYAKWGESLAGHSVTLTKEGSYSSQRGFDYYKITGELTITYLYYGEKKGSYYIRNEDTTTYTDMVGRSYTDSKTSTYWGSETKATVVFLDDETISTEKGMKLCSVKKLIYENGTVETQWMADGWILYRVEVDQVTGSGFDKTERHLVYTYKSDTYSELPSDCTLDVVAAKGITVTGNESPYRVGQQFKLTASASGEEEFGGWYDSSMNLISSDPVYEDIVGGESLIYAANKRAFDVTFSSDEDVDLSLGGEFSDATYTITNIDTDEVSLSESGTYSFPDGGMYTVIVDKQGEKSYYMAKVSGDATRSFVWKYNRYTYTLELDIDYDDLLYARGLYSVNDRCQKSATNHDHDKTFVTLSYTDETMSPYMDELTDKLIAALQSRYSTVSEEVLVGYLLAFTQYIEYQADDAYMGTNEYWKFPLETLYDQGGDCEDTAILFCSIAHQCREKLGMSYETALLLLPGHMAGAVKFSTSDKYSYCETTMAGFDVGKIPDTMKEYVNTDDCKVVEIA